MTDTSGPDATEYTYRPSVLGSPWTFHLLPDGLTWQAGSRTGRAAYTSITRVRMSYRPATMQSYRFMTEIWAMGAPKLRMVSTSWRNMVDMERRDPAYVQFVTTLHRNLVAAGTKATFDTGTNPLVYWLGVTVFVGTSLALAGLVVRALQGGQSSGAIVIGIFLGVFLWQAGNYFRRNRPRVYRPDALPPELIPAAKR
jgi:hypothetical protein